MWNFLLCCIKENKSAGEGNESKFSIEALPNQEGGEIREAIGNLCIKRVCQLLKIAMNGYFHIGPLREIKAKEHVEPDSSIDYEDTERRDRYVGKRGEYIHLIYASFFLNTMIASGSKMPYAGLIDNSFKSDDPRKGRNLFSCLFSYNDPIYPHIWERAAAEPKDFIANQIKCDRRFLERFLDHYYSPLWLRLAENELSAYEDLEFEDYQREFPSELADAVCNLFNSVLSRRDLYSTHLWPEPGIEASFYLEQGIESLSIEDLIRLNRILLDQKISHLNYWCLEEHYGFIFNVYYSKCLEYLSKVKCVTDIDEKMPADFWTVDSSGRDMFPAGYLLSFKPGQREDDEAFVQKDGIDRYRNPAFREDLLASPANLSAGFHQIAPIIVQAGVMKKHELCSIENPEAHLHPNMQLKFIEFLISQAKIGKFFLIETHSDLVIRRIIRARLAEEYGEEMFKIYFTSLKSDSPAKNAYSVAEKIDVNGRGQISNWPEGFLDDDLKESRLLMDVMYGGIGEAGDNENE